MSVPEGRALIKTWLLVISADQLANLAAEVNRA
jgi:hypothetical protein